MKKNEPIIYEHRSPWVLHRTFTFPGRRLEVHTHTSGGELIAMRIWKIGEECRYYIRDEKHSGYIKNITASNIILCSGRRIPLADFVWTNTGDRRWGLDAALRAGLV